MIKKYVKKRIPIEAIQWTGSNFEELQAFAGSDLYMQNGRLYIHTLEGDMAAANPIGDYLVKGIKGEFYFCEKAIFEESYEEYEEPLTYEFTQQTPVPPDYYMQGYNYVSPPSESGMLSA